MGNNRKSEVGAALGSWQNEGLPHSWPFWRTQHGRRVYLHLADEKLRRLLTHLSRDKPRKWRCSSGSKLYMMSSQERRMVTTAKGGSATAAHSQACQAPGPRSQLCTWWHHFNVPEAKPTQHTPTLIQHLPPKSRSASLTSGNSLNISLRL